MVGDFTAPETASGKTGSQMTDGENAYEVSFTVTDTASGVGSLSVRIGDSDFTDNDNNVTATKGSGDNENTWTASIPSSKLSNLTNAVVYAQATDNVGNSYVFNAFQLTTDTIPPSVAITSPQNGSTDKIRLG